jgi:hypothetical protein
MAKNFKPLFFTVFIFLTVGSIASASASASANANAYPGVFACAVADAKVPLSSGHRNVLAEARSRITTTFGAVEAQAIIICFDDENAFWPLKLNTYGTTSFIGSKSCVVIGPNGQNVDVTAHELMRAEIAHRTGYWQRFTQLLTWYDEVLAMQVDYRPRYETDTGLTEDYVWSLSSARAFFLADDRQLRDHYAAAKFQVVQWVSNVGASSFYSYLQRVQEGEPFETVVPLNASG